MSSTQSGLVELTAALNGWRANKKKSERVPAELLSRARSLRGGDVSDREICKTTGLSWNQLLPKPKAKKPKAEFVEIPPVVTAEPVVVEIHDGEKSVIIRFGPSVDIEKLLSHFYI
jgi:hypothetical protein